MPKYVDVQTLIIECVDYALECFGKSVKRVVYFYLETEFQLLRSDISERPEDFSRALRAIFGCGAATIEELIVLRMQQKLKVKICPKTFPEAVMAVKT